MGSDPVSVFTLGDCKHIDTHGCLFRKTHCTDGCCGVNKLVDPFKPIN